MSRTIAREIFRAIDRPILSQGHSVRRSRHKCDRSRAAFFLLYCMLQRRNSGRQPIGIRLAVLPVVQKPRTRFDRTLSGLAIGRGSGEQLMFDQRPRERPQGGVMRSTWKQTVVRALALASACVLCWVVSVPSALARADFG